jgi:hypothetical protein
MWLLTARISSVLIYKSLKTVADPARFELTTSAFGGPKASEKYA